MQRQAAKSALFGAFASVAAALGNGRRAEIVDVLAQGARPVEAISTEIGQSFANTSQHLRVRERACLGTTSESGLRSSSSRPPNWRNDWPAVRLWCSTFARRSSTTLGTFPA